MKTTNIMDKFNTIEIYENKIELCKNRIKTHEYHLKRLTNYTNDIFDTLHKSPLESSQIVKIVEDRMLYHIAGEEGLINHDKNEILFFENKIKKIRDELEGYGIYYKNGFE